MGWYGKRVSGTSMEHFRDMPTGALAVFSDREHSLHLGQLYRHKSFLVSPFFLMSVSLNSDGEPFMFRTTTWHLIPAALKTLSAVDCAR